MTLRQVSELYSRSVMLIGALYIGLAFAIIYVASLHHRTTPRGRGLALVFGACLAAGQVLPAHPSLYPFVAWNMYSDPRPPDYFIQVRASDHGEAVPEFRFERHLLPFSPGPLTGYSTLGTITARVLQLIGHCRCTEMDSTVDRAIAALVAIHRLREGRHVDRIEIVEADLDNNGRQYRERRVYVWLSK